MHFTYCTQHIVSYGHLIKVVVVDSVGQAQLGLQRFVRLAPRNDLI